MALFHKSCSERCKDLKRVDENSVQCCVSENVDLPANAQQKKTESCADRDRLEIQYLKILVEEVSEKNEILKLNNQLLLEKVARLEAEKQGVKNARKNPHVDSRRNLKVENIDRDGTSVEQYDRGRQPTVRRQYSEVVQNSSAEEARTTSKAGVDVRQMSSNEVSVVSGDTETLTYAHATSMSNHVRERKHSNANVNRGYSDKYVVGRQPASAGDGHVAGSLISEEDGDGYRVVRNGRRGTWKRYGAGDGSNGFEGLQRNAWIYIGRVKPTVTVEKVQEFLQDKFPGKKFECEKLKSRGDHYGSFKIGADFSLREKLMDESLWPSGVVFRRFRFPPSYRKQETREARWPEGS